MEYQNFDPSTALATFVKTYWTLHIPKEAPREKQQILPDGCIEIIFILGDDIKRYTSETDYIIQPRSFVLGQLTDPYFVEPLGEVNSFAVSFIPGKFSYFVNTSLRVLANKETPLSELFDKDAVSILEDAIKNAATSEERVAIVENFLLDLIAQNTSVDEIINATIESIFQTKGNIGIEKMLKSYDLKRRQLERKFSKKVGISPKQLCRIIRLQASLQSMLNNEDKSLTHVGYENNFFDQSHFIKDFKDFTGISPKEFYKDEKFSLSSIIYGNKER
ncbi:AraC family transcriptional regulator [Portibacter lacus]|uniref:AraC family transcriptional regulator n=1 Tax=Portibacter lacus TaxID=1099794 RepID=A0AA37SSC2_9BACT|nr:helix-turn-helix domain-containing protein [Portibacter lacus]GLR19523.1 AraC family transcriptional regulator [Portibacter lacus]